MTTNAHLFHTYSTEILSFTWTDQDAALSAPAQPTIQNTEAQATRLLRIFEKSHKNNFVLFGAGSGALAAELDRRLPEEAMLYICDLSPERIRGLLAEGRLSWNTPNGRAQILVDTSPWTHVLQLGLNRGGPNMACLQLNPELEGDEKESHQALQRTLTASQPKQAINGTPFGHFGVQAPSLSVGCILHPDEPDLDSFFRQFPDWVEELVILWDAEEVPERDCIVYCPIKQFAHPLGEDFAAQRNRLLKACEADWVLMLDADERLHDTTWTLLPGLFPVRDVDAYFFPRQTFFPDAEHCRAGYGLWPDLQLRLFRNLDELTFERPVHERLTGFTGKGAIVLDAPILHSTHLTKRPDEVRAKLELFDRAGEGSIAHRLNKEYPHLPATDFRQANILTNELSLLILPDVPA